MCPPNTRLCWVLRPSLLAPAVRPGHALKESQPVPFDLLLFKSQSYLNSITMKRKRRVREIPVWIVPCDWDSHCPNRAPPKQRGSRPPAGRGSGTMWHCDMGVCVGPWGRPLRKGLANLPHPHGDSPCPARAALLDLSVVPTPPVAAEAVCTSQSSHLHRPPSAYAQTWVRRCVSAPWLMLRDMGRQSV